VLSIIMPTLNESATLQHTLLQLQPLRTRGHEIILVDGGSVDGTVELAEQLTDRLIQSSPGRARQMNAGAQRAAGDVLWFLHADTVVPPAADRLILNNLHHSGRHWGRFDIRLSGKHPLLRLVGRMMNLRSGLTGIATGDQGIFVRRGVFQCLGGFPDIPLMEDIALSRDLKRFGRPGRVSQPLITSSRRWEEKGIVRTILLMWRLRIAYFLGADLDGLARQYIRG
jgi:rSAM/selenodomain-associated transferase 2